MHRRSPRVPEGVLSERILLIILILGLFLGCAVVPPVPVELHRFADNSTIQNLTFSGGDRQPLDLLITKYTVVGNYSEPPNGKVIKEFSFWACPYDVGGSNVSNLAIYWPEGGSTPLYSGTLDTCQRLYADPAPFNQYLSVRSATPFLAYMTGSLPSGLPENFSFLMLENPRMHHYAETVKFQFAVPYAPLSIIAELANQTIPPEYAVYENTRILGMKYTCYEGGPLLTMYGPTRSWNISMALPPINISGLPINLSAGVTGTGVFNLYDLPCPAYGAPGKYTAEVRSLYVNVTNYTGWIPDSVFYEDFNSSVLDSIWDVRAVNGSGFAYLVNNYTDSKADFHSYSANNDSAIIMYYSTAITPPDSNDSGVYIEAKVPGSETRTVTNAFAGIFLLNETVGPGAAASIMPYLRGMFVFNNETWLAYCPSTSPGSPPDASGSFADPGATHSFVIGMTNETMAYMIDEVPVLWNCTPPNESVYVGFSSDPITDMWEGGNMSIDYVQIMDVSFKTNYTGVLWVDMSLLPFGRSYADVLVCDCPEQYNRPFTFNIGSDTPGTLEISDINVSYDALISYDSDGVTPTSSIETDKFSWVAINSRITDSSMGYQSGLYNSTVDNSELILSSLTCYNVTNSELVIALMGGNTGLLPPGPCANEIRDSKLDFVMMLGGSVVNSTLIGIPIMAFTDFQDAHVENLTLYQGNMILNGTRFPNFFNQSQDIGGVFSLLGTNSFPLGCSEDSFFVVDSVLDLSLGGLNAGTINCRFKVLNSNFTIYNITFQNEFGGFRGELKGSNLFVRDMPGPTNIALFGGETDIIFYGVNTSDYGTLLFSSNDIHVDNGFASINGSANGGQLAQLASDVQTTLVFYNIDDFDGHITYYENFTTNETEAVERGIPCPSSVCSNLRYNSAERTVTVDVNNFSTYVLNYTPLPPVPDNGGSDRDLAISVAGTCLREQVQFNATSGASRVSGVDITLYYPVSGFSHIHTGTGGTAAFIPTQAGTYRFSAYASGYRQVDGTFSEEECAPQVPPVQNETVAPTPPAQETPEEETGGTVAPGQPPAQPPEQVEVPAQPPAQPPQEGTPSEQPEQLPPTTQAQSCCFLFCAQLFGICWYWWLIILIIIIAGAYQLSKSLAK